MNGVAGLLGAIIKEANLSGGERCKLARALLRFALLRQPARLSPFSGDVEREKQGSRQHVKTSQGDPDDKNRDQEDRRYGDGKNRFHVG